MSNLANTPGPLDPELQNLILQTPTNELAGILATLPPSITDQVLSWLDNLGEGDLEHPATVIEQAQILDPAYVTRPHLDFLAAKIAQALARVEAGENVHMTISMPPRTGKSFTISTYTPTWLLNCHPDWNIGLISHSPTLANSWGRANRRLIEQFGAGEHGSGKLPRLELARDARAVASWETTAGGSLLSRSVKQALAGVGFKVLIVDDAVKDIASASNPNYRQAMWEWWKADVLSRMQPPYLLIVVGTRWHEDDLIGRILSPEHEGDPALWEQITFPAIATEASVDPATGRDILGRRPGDPLISPLVPNETREQALERWRGLEESVGSYYWSALYQQRPAPESGGIFNLANLRYWTTDPAQVDESTLLLDGSLVERWQSGTWLDSWDTSFKGTETSDYVVGQRWVRAGADRFLVAQQRGQWGYTQTLSAMRQWAKSGDNWPGGPSPFGALVHQRHIEEKANGAALIEKLRTEVAGVKGINPRMGKEARARVITPELESGNVYLPHPAMVGFEWVASLLSELRNFPRDAHDDQVDAFTQALLGLRDSGSGRLTVPLGTVNASPLSAYQSSLSGGPLGRGGGMGGAGGGGGRRPLSGRTIR